MTSRSSAAAPSRMARSALARSCTVFLSMLSRTEITASTFFSCEASIFWPVTNFSSASFLRLGGVSPLATRRTSVGSGPAGAALRRFGAAVVVALGALRRVRVPDAFSEGVATVGLSEALGPSAVTD